MIMCAAQAQCRHRAQQRAAISQVFRAMSPKKRPASVARPSRGKAALTKRRRAKAEWIRHVRKKPAGAAHAPRNMTTKRRLQNVQKVASSAKKTAKQALEATVELRTRCDDNDTTCDAAISQSQDAASKALRAMVLARHCADRLDVHDRKGGYVTPPLLP